VSKSNLALADAPILCEGVKELASTPYYVVMEDVKCKVIFATRTSLPFETLGAIESCFALLAEILEHVVRSDYVLLVDVRRGPARNDPDFEEVISRERGKLLHGFARNAALARSAAGALQIKRYAKADRRTVFVTSDPQIAFEHLGISYHPV